MPFKSQNRSVSKQNIKVSDKKVKSGQKKGIKNSKYSEIIQKLESHENTPQAIAEDNTKITTRPAQQPGRTKKRSNSNPNFINDVTKRSQMPPFSFSTRVVMKKDELLLSKACSKLPLEKINQSAENKIQVQSKPKPHPLQQEEREIEELEKSLDLLEYLTHSTRGLVTDRMDTSESDFTQNTQKLLTPPYVEFENNNTNRQQLQNHNQGRKRRGFTIGAVPKKDLVSKYHFRQHSDNTALRTNKQSYLHVRSNTAQTLPHIIVQGDFTNEPFTPLKPMQKRSRSRLSSMESILDGTALNWYSEDIQSHTMQRKDSGLSMTYDAKYEELVMLLGNERAKVERLQRDKQAILKDMDASNQIIDKLTKENIELKKKFELEKINHKKCQEELLLCTEKINKLTEQTRKPKFHSLKIETDNDSLLKKQLESTQLQVRLLKSTMKEFLRIGIFNDQLISPSAFTPTNRTPTSPPAFPPTHTTKNADEKVKREERENEEKQEKQEEKETKEDLDIKLNQLLTQKKILQSEYNRLPSFNNALARKQRDEYEAKLDQFDSQIYSLKFKIRTQRNSKCI